MPKGNDVNYEATIEKETIKSIDKLQEELLEKIQLLSPVTQKHVETESGKRGREALEEEIKIMLKNMVEENILDKVIDSPVPDRLQTDGHTIRHYTALAKRYQITKNGELISWLDVRSKSHKLNTILSFNDYLSAYTNINDNGKKKYEISLLRLFFEKLAMHLPEAFQADIQFIDIGYAEGYIASELVKIVAGLRDKKLDGIWYGGVEPKKCYQQQASSKLKEAGLKEHQIDLREGFFDESFKPNIHPLGIKIIIISHVYSPPLLENIKLHIQRMKADFVIALHNSDSDVIQYQRDFPNILEYEGDYTDKIQETFSSMKMHVFDFTAQYVNNIPLIKVQEWEILKATPMAHYDHPYNYEILSRQNLSLINFILNGPIENFDIPVRTRLLDSLKQEFAEKNNKFTCDIKYQIVLLNGKYELALGKTITATKASLVMCGSSSTCPESQNTICYSYAKKCSMEQKGYMVVIPQAEDNHKSSNKSEGLKKITL